jgi:WD40 repeat protein
MIGVLDAKSLAVSIFLKVHDSVRGLSLYIQPITTILKAHDLPPTTLRFNPEGTLLLSGSADNTIRLIVVPLSGAGPGKSCILCCIFY